MADFIQKTDHADGKFDFYHECTKHLNYKLVSLLRLQDLIKPFILLKQSIAELDLRNFTYGGVTITGFQIVNRDSPSVKQLQHNWNQLNTELWSGAGQKLSVSKMVIFINQILMQD